MTKSNKAAAAVVETVVAAEVKVKKTMKFYSAGKNIAKPAKAPKQFLQILDFMIETGVKEQGAKIIEKMIEAGKIETRQNPAVLFAFYARKLEQCGVIRS